MVKKKKLKPASQIAFGFLLVIIVGTFLLCLPCSSKNGQWFSFVDSLLTSTSAVCVTGLIVVDTAVHFSLFGQIVILLLIQIGGLGFITLTSLIFLLIGKKIGYEQRVAMQESLSQENNQGIVKFVRNIIIVVFSIEFIGFLCLAPSMISNFGWGDGIFKALFLSISAFCNAGFDVLGTYGTEFQNLGVFAENSLVLLPIMFLIVVGGIGFVVLFDVGKRVGRQKKKMSLHSKIVLITTLVLVFGGAIIFAILEWNNPNTIGNMSVWDKIVNSFFQSITPRTAGFTTFDQSKLTQASVVVTDILMFIGGSPASTAGGIKTITFVILLLFVFKTQNSKGDIIVCKKKISQKTVQKALKIFCIAVVLILVSTMAICIFEGPNVTLGAVLYEVISAISTVGLTMGITPTLGGLSKLVLILLMFVGRVGALTFTVALGNKSVSQDIEYPDSKIIVG